MARLLPPTLATSDFGESRRDADRPITRRTDGERDLFDNRSQGSPPRRHHVAHRSSQLGPNPEDTPLRLVEVGLPEDVGARGVDPRLGDDDVKRAMLDIYDLKRLTTKVSSLLDRYLQLARWD